MKSPKDFFFLLSQTMTKVVLQHILVLFENFANTVDFRS